jgi:hypothetical protein
VRVSRKIVVLPLIRGIDRVLHHDIRPQDEHVRLTVLPTPEGLTDASSIHACAVQRALVRTTLGRKDSQLRS